MVRARVLAFVIALVLVGCTSGEVSEATEAPIQEPLPLEEIAIVDGDLPAGFALGQQLIEPPVNFRDLPGLVDFFGRTGRSGDYVFEIYLYLFGSRESAAEAFGALSDGATEDADFGEEGRISSTSSPIMPVVFSKVAFMRCNAAALIIFPTSESALRNYAIRLDRRILDAYCD